jgi:long-subunit fatty acid transport protein
MRGSPPVLRRSVLAAAGLLLLLGGPAFAQITVPTPDAPDREYDPSQLRPDLTLGSGARALGMGGAFLARADDASAASWNPAGLSYLRRPEVSLAGIYTRETTEGFTLASKLPDPDDPVTPKALANSDRRTARSFDFLSLAVPFEIGSASGAAQLSVQRAVSLGGRRLITRPPGVDLVIDTDTSKGFDFIALGVGVQATQQLRVGGTVNHWINGYRSTADRCARSQSPSLPDCTSVDEDRTHHETDFGIYGWNLNAGVIWTPFEHLNIGLVGKTPFDSTVRLDRDRTDYLAEGRASIVQPHHSDSGLRLHFPGSAGVGASWRVQNALTVSMDFTRTFWSDAWIENYYDLTQNQGVQTFPQRLPFPSLGTSGEQKDTQQIRIGAEYVVLFERVKWPLRAGYFNDRQYYQSDDLNTPRFNAFTFGTGISAGNFLVDVAYVGEYGRYTKGNDVRVASHRIFMSFIFRPGNY